LGTYIAVVCFLVEATPLFAISYPTNANLISDIELPLISGNKIVGKLKVTKGENIKVLSEANGTIELQVRNLKGTTSIDNTTLKKLREEESNAIAASIKEEEKKARLEEQRNSEENQRRIIEDGENG
jgi:FixJ family two-component response regulator